MDEKELSTRFHALELARGVNACPQEADVYVRGKQIPFSLGRNGTQDLCEGQRRIRDVMHELEQAVRDALATADSKFRKIALEPWEKGE
jgi:hypothetical protein